MKNPTPHQISIRISIGVSLAVALVAFASYIINQKPPPWIPLLIILGASLSTSYLLVSYYLKKYIYRKIKLIYKSIHKNKLGTEEKKQIASIDLRKDIISQVQTEVDQWAISKQAELEKLKSWAEYRRKYIGDVSHELKTPIFNIQGFVHTLIDGALYDPSVNKNYLKKAATNIDRLQTIVDDLESISRLESGELILDIRTFDIKELTKEVFEDLAIKAAAKNIQLTFKDATANNYRVRADRDYIRQVLINLIQNSIKYGNENGRTKVAFYDMDVNILVEIADNGIGIPGNHIDHVFDRFYRVDKSRSREQGGSGLGLSIVKHIIEAHKQTINVRSSLNLGSTFGFTLEKVRNKS